MCRHAILAIVSLAVLMSCSTEDPITPDANEFPPQVITDQSIDSNPYNLWGLWRWDISEDHSEINAAPIREAQFHMNALKFLEAGPCNDCVNIDSIKPGDEPGTVDVQVTIRNPFPVGQLEYTGFDVKGILMFPATYYCATCPGKGMYPTDDAYPPSIETATFISWREWGDPEVLNPDGYSYRWSPTYMEEDWDGDQPILQYWPGKYATGEPNAHINAHLNFYTHEQRHMFYPGLPVTRTYTIWLPPGPVVAAYAVEACWEPPVNIPVTNPASDFPETANQPEPYHFNMIMNNGEIISKPSPGCCGWFKDGNTQRVEFERWFGSKPWISTSGKGFIYNSGCGLWQCDTPPDAWCTLELIPELFSNGKHRMMGVLYDLDWQAQLTYDFAFTLIDFTIEIPDD